MKKDFLCRADELHHSLEVFFRENPGWEDAFICADKDGIYGVRIDYEGPWVETKPVYEVNKKRT